MKHQGALLLTSGFCALFILALLPAPVAALPDDESAVMRLRGAVRQLQITGNDNHNNCNGDGACRGSGKTKPDKDKAQSESRDEAAVVEANKPEDANNKQLTGNGNVNACNGDGACSSGSSGNTNSNNHDNCNGRSNCRTAPEGVEVRKEAEEGAKEETVRDEAKALEVKPEAADNKQLNGNGNVNACNGNGACSSGTSGNTNSNNSNNCNGNKNCRTAPESVEARKEAEEGAKETVSEPGKQISGSGNAGNCRGDGACSTTVISPSQPSTGSNRDDQPGFFADPMIGNYRLDMCAYFPSPGQPDVSSCGKPAADLFCQKHGFKSAASFEGYSGYGQTTISIGDNKLNTVKTQDAIKNIQCV